MHVQYLHLLPCESIEGLWKGCVLISHGSEPETEVHVPSGSHEYVRTGVK